MFPSWAYRERTNSGLPLSAPVCQENGPLKTEGDGFSRGLGAGVNTGL